MFQSLVYGQQCYTHIPSSEKFVDNQVWLGHILVYKIQPLLTAFFRLCSGSIEKIYKSYEAFFISTIQCKMPSCTSQAWQSLQYLLITPCMDPLQINMILPSSQAYGLNLPTQTATWRLLIVIPQIVLPITWKRSWNALSHGMSEWIQVNQDSFVSYLLPLTVFFRLSTMPITIYRKQPKIFGMRRWLPRK